jgi:autotransporter-associated beta strand protein
MTVSIKRSLLASATALALCAMTGSAHAQLSVSSPSGSYTIDFDNTVSDVNNGQWAGTGFQSSPASGQLDSDAWAVTGWSDGSLLFGGTRTSPPASDFARGSATAAVTTGGMYAFSGGNISTGHALGIQPGGNDFAPGTLTLKIVNNSGSTITGMDVGYLLYVRNDQGRANSFNFSYSPNDGTYTPVTALNYTSAQAADTAGFVSNSEATTLTGLSIANGDSFYVRWDSADVSGSGSRDEFALDNIFFDNFITAAPIVPLYWDLTPGAGIGGAGPATWDTTTQNWNSSSNGDAAQQAWTSANQAVFGGTAGQVNIDPLGVTANAGLQFTSSGYTVAGGTLTLGPGSDVNVVNASDTAWLSAPIAGTDGFTKSGAGELIITSLVSSFTGTVNINGGTLNVSSDANLGDAGNDIVLGNGALQLGANLTLGAGRDLSGSGLIDPNGSTLTTNGVTNLTSLTVTGPGNINLSGSSNTIGALTYTAAADLEVANGTLSGNLTTSNSTGTAKLGGAINLGGVRTFSIDNGAANTDFELAANLSGAGRTTFIGDGAVLISGDNSAYTGGFRIFAPTSPATGTAVTVTNKNALGPAGATLQFNGGSLAATTDLTGANALPVSISQGGDAAIGGSQPIEITGGWEFFGNSGGVNVKTLTVDNTTTLSGAIGLRGVAAAQAGTLGFVKAGGGALILNTTNSFNGTISISSGTLAIGASGDINAARSVALSSSASHFDVSNKSGFVLGSSQTLSGIGSVNGAMAAAGTLSPGNGDVGQLTVGNIALGDPSSGGGHYAFDISSVSGTGHQSSGADEIVSTGAISVNATPGAPFTIHLGSNTVSGIDPAAFYAWILIDGQLPPGGTIDPNAFVVDASAFKAANRITQDFTVTYDSINNDLILAVPEPGAATLLIIGAAGLLTRRKRRRLEA